MKILTSREMHHLVWQNPQDYPHMLLRNTLAKSVIDKYEMFFHIFPVKYRNKEYRGMIPNHFKQIPPAYNTESNHGESVEHTIKKTEFNPNRKTYFQDLVQREDNTALMIFDPSMPFQMKQEHLTYFVIEEMILYNRIERGIVCVYNEGFTEDKRKEFEENNGILITLQKGFENL